MRPPRAATASTKPVHRTSAAVPAKAASSERSGFLSSGNAARFVLLPDMEAIGQSRSYSNEPTDPDRCAEKCLASDACSAFSFEKSTKICYLISKVSSANANSAFISGRVR